MAKGLGSWLRSYAERSGRGYPDWAVRYLPIVRRLGNAIPRATAIVEIGANANGLAVFAQVPVIAIDTSLTNLLDARKGRERLVRPVLADATALPFADASVDLVVCVDTFEHLPQAVRDGAAAEIARVLDSNGTAAIAFPSGEAALQAERRIADEYRHATGRTLSWFDEHAAMGLPDAAQVRHAIGARLAASHAISCSQNASIGMWTWMWRVLLCGWPGRGNAVFQALLRLLTPLLSRMHFGVCYRAIIWVEPRNR